MFPALVEEGVQTAHGHVLLGDVHRLDLGQVGQRVQGQVLLELTLPDLLLGVVPGHVGDAGTHPLLPLDILALCHLGETVLEQLSLPTGLPVVDAPSAGLVDGLVVVVLSLLDTLAGGGDGLSGPVTHLGPEVGLLRYAGLEGLLLGQLLLPQYILFDLVQLSAALRPPGPWLLGQHTGGPLGVSQLGEHPTRLLTDIALPGRDARNVGHFSQLIQNIHLAEG